MFVFTSSAYMKIGEMSKISPGKLNPAISHEIAAAAL